MIFKAVANAESSQQMPKLTFEHERSKHAGYVAMKRAFKAAFESELVDHAIAVLGSTEATVNSLIPNINVCMWEKKDEATIISPAICLGYPRYMRELSGKVIVLDNYIRHTLKNFTSDNIVICFDNNLYIKETSTPIEEDALALALIYYMAHLQGKLEAMKTQITASIAPVFRKTAYVPTPRVTIDIDKVLTEDAQKRIRKNGQGIDIDTLQNQISDAEQKIIDANRQVAQWEQKKVNLENDMRTLLDNPNACPALEAIKKILTGLGEHVVDINVGSEKVELTIEMPLSEWDQENVTRKFRSGYIRDNLISFNDGHEKISISRSPTAEEKEFYCQLAERLFVKRDLAVMTTNVLVITLYPFTYQWKTHSTRVNKTGFTNPHIYYYNCWSEAENAISKAYKAGNYELIPLYLKNAISQVSLDRDIAPRYFFWELHKALITNNPNRVFIDTDGFAYTIKELYDLR